MSAQRVPDVSRQVWAQLPLRTTLPWAEDEYLAAEGPVPANGASRRQYHRFHLRDRAVLRTDGETFAVYAKDISRIGIGLLAPQQLFPCDRVRLLMADYDVPPLEVRRCRRIAPGCYEIGAVFVDGVLAASLYKEFVRQQDATAYAD